MSYWGVKKFDRISPPPGRQDENLLGAEGADQAQVRCRRVQLSCLPQPKRVASLTESWLYSATRSLHVWPWPVGLSGVARTHIQSDQLAANGITVLVISRVATLAPVAPAYIAAVRDFVSKGGSVLAEYDGAALLFDAEISGGGGLVPFSTDSTMSVLDVTDPLMAGMPTTYNPGTSVRAFSVSNQNAVWLHTSAVYTSSGHNTSLYNWPPAGTFPAIASGQCGTGRVAIDSMSHFDTIGDLPVQTFIKKSIHWLTGI